MLRRLEEEVNAAAEAEKSWRRLADEGQRRRARLSSWARSRLSRLRESGLKAELTDETAEEMVASVRLVYEEAVVLAAEHDVSEMRTQVSATKAEITPGSCIVQ